MAIEFPTSETVVVCTECALSWDAHLRLARNRQVMDYHQAYEEWEQSFEAYSEPTPPDFNSPPPAPSFRDCVQLLKEQNRGPMGPQGPMGAPGMPAP